MHRSTTVSISPSKHHPHPRLTLQLRICHSGCARFDRLGSFDVAKGFQRNLREVALGPPLPGQGACTGAVPAALGRHTDMSIARYPCHNPSHWMVELQGLPMIFSLGFRRKSGGGEAKVTFSI